MEVPLVVLPIIGKIFTDYFLDNLWTTQLISKVRSLFFTIRRNWKEVSVSIPAVNIVVNLWTSLWSVSCIKSQNFLPQQCYPQLEKKCLLQTYILNHVYLMTFCPLRLKLFGYNDVIFTTTHVNQLYSKNKCQNYTCSCKL